MMEHLPVLVVIVPLLAAPLCVLANSGVVSLILGILALSASAVGSVLLLQRVVAEGPIRYFMGGWAPPIGIEYRIDAANALILVLVSVLGAAVLPAAVGPTRAIVRPQRASYVIAVFLLCATGLLGMAATGDAFNVFVFLEISSLAGYALVSMGRNRRALTAAFNYLIMGAIGGTFVLIGIGLAYSATGTLNMLDLSERLAPLGATSTVLVAFAFIMVGISIKLAVYPLHQWLPAAYGEAPDVATAFLAGSGTKVIYYLFLRFIFTVFGAKLIFDQLGFGNLLMALSLLAMFAGSLAAVYQKSLKRLLAYSSIAQVGYLTLGLSLGTEKGVAAGMLHVFNHGLTKSALFLIVAGIVVRTGSDRIESLAGVGRRYPAACLIFLVGGMGLIGVPGTAGFVSKWYLVLAALREDRWEIAFAVLLSSMLAVAYVWRFVEVAYFREPEGEPAEAGRVPLSVAIPAGALALLTIVFGVFSTAPAQVAHLAAQQLLGGAP